MDYRYYRGDRPKLPGWLRRHLHKLRYIGAIMMVSTPIIGWLTVLKIINITFFWYLFAIFCQGVGILFYIIGLTFNNLIDKSQ